MASDIFWARRTARIDDPDKMGTLARMPMPQEHLMAAVVPQLAVDDAIVLGVVGRKADAHRLLTSFFSRLLRLLDDESWLEEFAAWEQYQRLSALSSFANITHWLLYGAFDPGLADRAYNVTWSWQRRDASNARPDSTALLHVILLRIEMGDEAAARELYESHEPKRVAIPPDSMRFARNPRSLLYAHLRREELPPGTLNDARELFRKAATQWDKRVDPVPYVMLSEVTRILAACRKLAGLPYAPDNIYPLLR